MATFGAGLCAGSYRVTMVLRTEPYTDSDRRGRVRLRHRGYGECADCHRTFRLNGDTLPRHRPEAASEPWYVRSGGQG